MEKLKININQSIRRFRHFRNAISKHRIGGWLVIILCIFLLVTSGGRAETTVHPFRVGFSVSSFINVNENDAKAALKIWGQKMAKDSKCPIDPDLLIFNSEKVILQQLLEKKVDAVAVTITEYARLSRKVRLAPQIFLLCRSGKVTEQLILLARKDGTVKKLSDLRGRSIQIQADSRSCLATVWFDTLLASNGLPVSGRLCKKIVQNSKIDKLVLSVFFGQADACIVTRNGFRTMNDLNPQLASQLAVLASSPEMVPTLFAFRADFHPIYKNVLLDTIRDMRKTVAGQQTLVIFGADSITQESTAIIEPALKMIENYEKKIRRLKQ